MIVVRNNTPSLSAQREAVYREVAALATYEPNWNGEGALPARPGVVEATLRFLPSHELNLFLPADAYLAPDGTVILEWHFPDGRITIANIRVADRAELTHRTPGQNPRFETLPIPPGTAPVATNSTAFSERIIAG